jgi:6-phosphogluconolactonase (cycloisomerase 2 family)
MRKRLTWLVGIAVLVSIGLLMACSSKYSSSNNGLVIVPSQGFDLMQTFSLDPTNGQIETISNTNGPTTPGLPSEVVIDPNGAYVFVLTSAVPGVMGTANAIAVYSVNSDGTLAGPTNYGACATPTTTAPICPNPPAALAIDSAGKFLFVTDGIGGDIWVFSIGSSGSLALVGGSPFSVPGSLAANTPNLVALAVSPTTFPTQFAVCSNQTPPTNENLYVVDSLNNQVWEFGVDSSTGALGNPTGDGSVLGFATGDVPYGVAVDPCNRFLYVANQRSNNVSAYTMCTPQSIVTCAAQDGTSQDGSLIQVTGSPYAAALGPGPLTVDPLGSFLYVVDTQANVLSAYKIGAANGSLSPLTPATIATGSNPVGIAIRGDDTWVFVTNNGSTSSGSVSQYSLTPATGTLTPLTPITTYNYPSGVVVK